MTVRPRFVRIGWLFAAVFQLMLPTFASVADARAEATSNRSSAAAHIEAYGTKGCARVHPADCALCQVLSTGARASEPTTLSVPVAREVAVVPTEFHGLRRIARPAGDPPQRAPPV
jgi:hypothetical protein